MAARICFLPTHPARTSPSGANVLGVQAWTSEPTTATWCAAPSKHKSGRDYTWEVSAHPDDQDPAELPAWLLTRLLRRRRKPKRTGASGRSGTGEGISDDLRKRFQHALDVLGVEYEDRPGEQRIRCPSPDHAGRRNPSCDLDLGRWRLGLPVVRRGWRGPLLWSDGRAMSGTRGHDRKRRQPSWDRLRRRRRQRTTARGRCERMAIGRRRPSTSEHLLGTRSPTCPSCAGNPIAVRLFGGTSCGAVTAAATGRYAGNHRGPSTALQGVPAGCQGRSATAPEVAIRAR